MAHDTLQSLQVAGSVPTENWAGRRRLRAAPTERLCPRRPGRRAGRCSPRRAGLQLADRRRPGETIPGL